jgi:hypothetical protein
MAKGRFNVELAVDDTLVAALRLLEIYNSTPFAISYFNSTTYIDFIWFGGDSRDVPIFKFVSYVSVDCFPALEDTIVVSHKRRWHCDTRANNR